MVFRFVLLLMAVCAFGQPVITYRGVLNAASLAPPGLPNGGLGREACLRSSVRTLGRQRQRL